MEGHLPVLRPVRPARDGVHDAAFEARGDRLEARFGGAEREREQGLQTDYDEIYVRSLTGISNIEQEIQESTPAEEPRTT